MIQAKANEYDIDSLCNAFTGLQRMGGGDKEILDSICFFIENFEN